MKFQAVLFDLDGTLLDTVPGLSKSMNEILEKYQFPLHSIDEYKRYIGNGVHALVEQSAPPGTSREVLQQLYNEKSALYDLYWKEGTSLFPGISDMLDAIEGKSIPKAIFSNKEDHFTQHIVSFFLSNWTFTSVQGRIDGIPKKPDPTGPLLIIHKTSVKKEQWVHVGDKPADAEVAAAIGCGFLWASWGYETKAPDGAVVLHSPQDLLRYI